jgi:hypothetical protein
MTSAVAAISDTGLRGYLKWLKADQPGLYTRVANAIAQAVPKGFSDYNQSLVRAIRRSSGVGAYMRTRMGALADDYSTSLYYTDPNYYSDDYGVSSGGTDTSTAANAGPTSSTVADTISAIVNGATTGYLTVQQAQAYNQINQMQLQRAQAGLPPAQISSGANGIPFISGSSLFGSSSLFPLVLIGGVLFVLATSKKRSA